MAIPNSNCSGSSRSMIYPQYSKLLGSSACQPPNPSLQPAGKGVPPLPAAVSRTNGVGSCTPTSLGAGRACSFLNLPSPHTQLPQYSSRRPMHDEGKGPGQLENVECASPMFACGW